MAMRASAVVAWVAVILACGMVFCAGCSKTEDHTADTPSASSTPAANDSPDKDSAAMPAQGDAEAVMAMRQELSRHWVRLPEGWISEYPARIRIATGQRDGPESFYRQIKQLKFDVETREISESDKLNGITFRGSCQFTHAPVRIYGDPNAFGPPRWSDWGASDEAVQMEKRNGKWTFGGIGYMVTGTQPSAATIATLK